MANESNIQPNTAIDPRDLRNAFGTFATGVTIVTTVEANGTPRGFTANSFTSVSLDPPLVLICIGKSAASLSVFCDGAGFAVNILGEGQEDVAGIFATQRADKFDVADWHPGKSGVPLIDGTNAWFECSREQVVEAGDHIVLIGRVNDYAYEQRAPLGYVNGGYFTLELERSLVEAASRTAGTIIGAVLAQNDSEILLHVDKESGKLTVPSTETCSASASPAALADSLSEGGLEVSLDFPLSVYEDKKTKNYSIYYRGTATGKVPEGLRFIPIEEIDFDKIEDGAMRFMLRRYVKELRQGRFAIYLGDEYAGETRQVEEKSEAAIDV